MSECRLSLSEPNAKIPHWSFSLPSGFTCPFAVSCLSKADRATGKIKDGAESDFRCFSASQEALYPSVRKSRWNNFEALKAIGSSNVDGMAKAIISSIENKLPRNQKTFRIHVGGDFFNRSYLNAWFKVANFYPDILFYAYSKSVPYFSGKQLPENFRVTFSKGGEHDDIIEKEKLKFSVVVFDEEAAANYVWYDKDGKKQVGLEIDHDDSHAWKDDKPFALLVHGTQPKGSEAAAALKKLGGISGKSSYGKRTSKPLDMVEGFSFKEWLLYNS